MNNGTASWRSPAANASPEISRPPQETDLLRGFVAVLLDGAALEELQVTQRLLRDRLPEGLRWARAEQLHLTLQFLGDMHPELLPEAAAWLTQACASHQPFSLSLANLGVFPDPRRPRVVYVGLDGEVDQLLNLQSEVSQAVARFGTHREKRPFHPHLTLARKRPGSRPDSALWQAIQKSNGPRPVPWTVREVHLMCSELHPAGARYTVLRSVPL